MSRKKTSKQTLPKFFIAYYMNQQKVFETRMLFDNELKIDSTSENQKTTNRGLEIGLEGETKTPSIIAKLKGNLKGDISHEKQQKVIDTLEYVNTKSCMLSDIMQHCTVVGSKVPNEGALVYIDSVKLELINEDEVRAMMTVMSGTFNGMLIPDAGNLDIGHMMQSLIRSGASFKLEGRRDSRVNPLYMKIPLDGEELFESKYTIDDLLIGKVSIVGICKGAISSNMLRSPLDYFHKNQQEKQPGIDNVVDCSATPALHSKKTDIDRPISEGLYIDVLAIIQAIELNGADESSR